jgi:hypothetical protein
MCAALVPLGLATTTAAADFVAATPAPDTPVPGLAGNVVPTVDTSGSTVAVAASSAPVDGAVAVLVRNGSARRVTKLLLSATAVTPDGGRAVKANAVDVVPGTLGPGELALARIVFRKNEVPAGETVGYHVRSTPTSTPSDPGSLDVRDLQLGPALEGPVAQTLAMTLANLGSRTINGPIRVTTVCFTEAGTPAFATTVTVKKAQVRKGGSAPLTVDLPELCPTYLVAAHGRVSG